MKSPITSMLMGAISGLSTYTLPSNPSMKEAPTEWDLLMTHMCLRYAKPTSQPLTQLLDIAAIAYLGLGDEADLIHFEMLKQAKQWGGIDHDVEHNYNEWLYFILKQAAKLAPDLGVTDAQRQAVYAKIGALAMSAAYAMRHKEMYGDPTKSVLRPTK